MYTKYLYNCYTLYYVVINYYDKVKTTFTFTFREKRLLLLLLLLHLD